MTDERTVETSKLTPALVRWLGEAADDERRTVLVRPRGAADAARTGELVAAGAEVESSGAGAVVAVVTPGALARSARLTWVAAITEPRTLDLKPGDLKPGG